MSNVMVSTRPLMRLEIELGPFLDVGHVPGGYRRVIPITGGTFGGGRLRGEVLPGGADWNLVRSDGTVHIWARYTLRTDDGVLIMITNEGLQPGAPETMARILVGEKIDTTDWYARTNPVFEVSGARYAWLNSRLFTGSLLPPTGPERVCVEISEIL